MGLGRSARIVALAGVLASVTLVPVPGAMAVGAPRVGPQAAGAVFVVPPFTIPDVVAFQDSSNTLAQNGNLFSGGSLGKPMAPGTSPVVIPQGGAGYEVVYQAADHHWAETGDAGTVETSFVMAAGTNPAAVLSPGASNGASWQNAWQGSNGNLWAQGTDLGLPMAPGTSPSMVWLGSGYEIIYQAGNHHLAEAGVVGTRDLGAAMVAGSSPAVVLSPGAPGAYQIAWKSPPDPGQVGGDGTLWASGPNGGTNLHLAMAANTSPSMVWLGTGYEVVYQAGDHHWAEAGVAGTTETSFVMAAGTSPLAVSAPGDSTGAWKNAWQGSNGHLWAQGQDTGVAMAPNTSPAIGVL
jgi:hypothetical protein